MQVDFALQILNLPARLRFEHLQHQCSAPESKNFEQKVPYFEDCPLLSFHKQVEKSGVLFQEVNDFIHNKKVLSLLDFYKNRRTLFKIAKMSKEENLEWWNYIFAFMINIYMSLDKLKDVNINDGYK